MNSYHPISKILHWLSAISIFLLFAMGFWMVDLSYYSDWYQLVPHWHKSVGILLLLITLARLLFKVILSAPPIEGARWEKISATLAHALLYLLLLATFISGYLISTADGRAIDVFNWFTVPSLGAIIDGQEDLAGNIHYYVTYILISLASLHALAAIKHHLINQDNTLKKML